MVKSLLIMSMMIAYFAAECVAQSTTVYRLVVPPSATVSDSGCACNGACQADSTWLLAGTYSAIGDCEAAIPNATVSVPDSSGNRTSNDCSQSAQCVPVSLDH